MGNPTPTPKPTVTAKPAATSAESSLASLAKSLGITVPTPSATTSTGSTAKPKVTKTYYQTVFTPNQAATEVEKQFNALFGRSATDVELKKYSQLLIKATKDLANAGVTNYNVKGQTATSVTTKGFNPSDWLQGQLLSDAKLNQEYQTYKSIAPEVKVQAAEKKIYEDLIKAAAGDAEKIKAAKESTSYGRDLNELEGDIIAKAKAEGAINTPDEISAIAKYILDKGLKITDSVAQSYLNKQFKFGKTKTTVGDKTVESFTGKAGSAVNTLENVANANGLDLNKVFDDATLPSVIADIQAGGDVNAYAKMVRDAAKVAWNVSDNVAKLMDQGLSLDAIYSPYMKTYANTLELNPNQVTLNDLAQYGIVGGDSKDKPVSNLYDFGKALRKDSRWQYTEQANTEVADATKKILQDFGFMG